MGNMTEITGRLNGLDALRGLAAMAVLVCHVFYIGKFDAPELIYKIAGHFTLAVQLFFALSAFSLAYTYIGKLGTWPEIGSYAIRRYLRIAPLFYFVMCIVLALSVARGHAPSLDVVLLNVSFLFGFSPTRFGSLVGSGWSIGVEMQFYVLFPILMLCVRSAKSAAVFALVAFLGGYVLDQLVDWKTGDRYRLFNIVANLANFAAGLWAFYVYKAFIGDTAARRIKLSALMFGIAFLIWFSAFATSGFFSGGVSSSYLWRYFVSAAFPFLILGVTLWDWPAFNTIVTNNLGKWSYSIYLLHSHLLWEMLPFRARLDSIFPGSWWKQLTVSIMVVGGITIILSALTYRFIEQPAQQAGKFFARRKPQLAPAE